MFNILVRKKMHRIKEASSLPNKLWTWQICYQKTLCLIIWRTVLFLCLSSETSLNIFFSHRTSTPSAFEVITVTRYINYLLTYLLTLANW